MRVIYALLLGLLTTSVCRIHAQPLLPYQNASLSYDVRVRDLISRLSAEEKFRQLFMVCGEPGADSLSFTQGLFGFQIASEAQQSDVANQVMTYSSQDDAHQLLHKINSIQSFFIKRSKHHIPIIAFDEALHGLVRKGATAFPQAIGMAASFDTLLMKQVAQAIARETRARGIRLVLSPVLNLATDVRWGRVEETYGEDPVLCSAMGLAYIKAFEQEGILTTPKHFIVNHGDGGRDSYPISLSERPLHEFYLKPFRDAIQQGKASAIMTAYNSYDGRPCTANDYLLKKVLREQLGFRGITLSDAAATGGANVLHFTASDYEDAGKQSVEHGLDVIFQSQFSSYPLFSKPFIQNKVNTKAIDSAVYRVLMKKMQLGLFDSPYTDTTLLQQIDVQTHLQLAYDMAVKSVVLLKNEQSCLPIANRYKRIALIGQDAVEVRLGGYSGPGIKPVSILEGMQKRLPKDCSVHYTKGCSRSSTQFVPIPAEQLSHYNGAQHRKGLKGSYYNDIEFQKVVLERVDEQLNFQWTLFGPDSKINYDFFAVQWDGFIQTKKTGNIPIGIEGNDGWQLYINDTLFLDRWDEQSYHTTTKSFFFEANKKYAIRIRYKEKSGNAWFKLVWEDPLYKEEEQNMIAAINLAKGSDLCIVVAGIEEGEFRDRSSLRLPGYQEELIHKVAATGKPLVVLLVGGSAVNMLSWLDETDAVLSVWYPGEQGGYAIADILWGNKNPSGKLPITFPMSEGQLPLVYNHLPTGRGDDYINGTGQALFPFGYGLSYSSFNYSNLQLSSTKFSERDTLHVSFQLKNTGSFDGEEVVQLYMHDEVAQFARPIKELKKFQRVNLKSGETKEVHFYLNASDLSYPDAQLNYITEPGNFRMMIGSSSKDIRLRTQIEFQ